VNFRIDAGKISQQHNGGGATLLRRKGGKKIFSRAVEGRARPEVSTWTSSGGGGLSRMTEKRKRSLTRRGAANYGFFSRGTASWGIKKKNSGISREENNPKKVAAGLNITSMESRLHNLSTRKERKGRGESFWTRRSQEGRWGLDIYGVLDRMRKRHGPSTSPTSEGEKGGGFHSVREKKGENFHIFGVQQRNPPVYEEKKRFVHFTAGCSGFRVCTKGEGSSGLRRNGGKRKALY